VRYKLAILNALARRPEGRATLDEVRREVGIIIASGDQTEQLKKFSALGDIDIYRSGWVLQDDAGLEITDAGRLLLHSLGDGNAASLEPASITIAQPPSLTDDLPGTVDQPKIVNAQPRAAPDNGVSDRGRSKSDPPPHKDRPRISSAMDDNKIEAIGLPKGTGAGIRPSSPAKKQSIFEIGRRYSAQETFVTTDEIPGRLTRHLGPAAIALLSLALVVACAVAAIAFGQIQSLKSDITAQRREFLFFKERIARLEQIETKKRESEQSDEQQKSDAEQNKPAEQTTLNLSREETQLIRDYIKLTPPASTTAPTINVGDPVIGAIIPLPSPVTDKIPRLLGGKFTTRNGAIIILKRGSRQADLILAPN
jgi:hypothetical protein